MEGTGGPRQSEGEGSGKDDSRVGDRSQLKVLLQEKKVSVLDFTRKGGVKNTPLSYDSISS